MNILRLSTFSLTLALAVFALGYVNPSFANPTGEKHNHGGGGEEPSGGGKALLFDSPNFSCVDGATAPLGGIVRPCHLVREYPPERTVPSCALQAPAKGR